MNIFFIIGVIVFVIKAQNTTLVEEPSDFIDLPDNEDNIVIVTEDVDAHCTISYAESAGTEHFSLSEFHSKDGTLVPTALRGNVQLLMEQLEVLREHIWMLYGREMPIIITSPYRSPSHNYNVGGVSNSYHLCAMGSDFYVPGLEHAEVQNIMNELMITGQIINGGLGRYRTFTHYDIGPMRRWSRL